MIKVKKANRPQVNSSRPLSARNARRMERKHNKDIGHGRNQKQLGREGQKEEGSGDSASL